LFVLGALVSPCQGAEGWSVGARSGLNDKFHERRGDIAFNHQPL